MVYRPKTAPVDKNETPKEEVKAEVKPKEDKVKVDLDLFLKEAEETDPFADAKAEYKKNVAKPNEEKKTTESSEAGAKAPKKEKAPKEKAPKAKAPRKESDVTNLVVTPEAPKVEKKTEASPPKPASAKS
jgi:hypothetical protein